jgi:hypothetical protein
LNVFLLSSTLILYLITLLYVLKSHRKITPMGRHNTGQVIKTIEVKMAHVQPGPSNRTTISISVQGQVNPRGSHVQKPNTIEAFRHKKIMSTLYLVGLLIFVLMVCTGPLVVSLSWYSRLSNRVKAILFCLSCINSTLNPIIYVWKLVDIRSMLRSYLCCFKS